MSSIANRLREPSSWAGFGLILMQAANAWATHDPAAIGSVIAGIVAIAAPEKKA